MPVLRSCCNFKGEFKMDNYCFIIGSFKLRSIVSKFRVSSHNLVIEKGRHVKPKLPLDQRICVMFNLNAVEEELHLLIKMVLLQQGKKMVLKMRDMEYINLEDKKVCLFYEY